jgi:hypothetical protein
MRFVRLRAGLHLRRDKKKVPGRSRRSSRTIVEVSRAEFLHKGVFIQVAFAFNTRISVGFGRRDLLGSAGIRLGNGYSIVGELSVALTKSDIAGLAIKEKFFIARTPN